MSAGRVLLSIYRRFQYVVFGRSRYGVMRPGVKVTVEPFRYEINHGDVVHPCVRFVTDGYLGHHWWMVYTPYYKSDATLENPVLCYAEGNDANEPPKEWKFFCLVNERPKNGYNSDPTLLYRDGALYVFWRENNEQGEKNYFRATFAAKVTSEGVEKVIHPLLVTNDEEEDAETCPCFMPCSDGKVMAYGMHLTFHSKRMKKMKPAVKNIAEWAVLIADLLGLYSQQKHYGLAIWHQPEGGWLKPYKYQETIRFGNCNALYRPWHMDFFDYQCKRYAIVQTNMSNADLCLAVSDDEKSFVFFKKPLITNTTIGKIGIYKPCAGVTPDGTFYLYYTAQDLEDRTINRIYLTTMPMLELLSAIQ